MCSQSCQDYLLSLVTSVWLQPRLHGVDVLLGALIGEPQSLELVLDVGQLRLKLPRFHRVLVQWMLEFTNQIKIIVRMKRQLSLFSGQVLILRFSTHYHQMEDELTFLESVWAALTFSQRSSFSTSRLDLSSLRRATWGGGKL